MMDNGQEEQYNQDGLCAHLKTRWAGRKALFYESLDSTNTQAGRVAEEGAPHGTLVVAERQTAGKGRRGRGWSSPAGSNIYFTLLLKPDFVPDKASMLTLLMAHSVARAITRVTSLEAGIKWPNDIVVNGKKVVGILTELNLERENIRHVVIGVGINVRKQEFPPEILDKATALEMECGKTVDRSELLAAVMEQFETDYEKFVQAENLSAIKESYHAMLVNLGREVCVLDPAGEYTGIARGITEFGELLVELPDGSIIKVYAGEVSVRGVLGYV